MYIISLHKETLRITIHNQYPGLELISPVYFSSDTPCHISPSQQTDAGTIMKASFGRYSKQEEFRGILLYKLQKKHTAKSDNQSDNSMTSIENTKTSLYFLVLWDVGYDDHVFRVCLVEYDRTLDGDDLWRLHYKYEYVIRNYYKSRTITWSMYDGAVMETRFDKTYRSDYKLDIVISEGTKKYIVEKPIRIDLKRLVLLLSMLFVLIYVVRLREPSLFELNIYNQCPNVNLVSLTCITDDRSTC
jgi:hypothetical protein